MAEIFTFQPAKVPPEGMRPAGDGETGIPEILQAFTELKRMVEAGEIEGLVIVGTLKEGDSFCALAGMMSPMTMAGILESTKLQLLIG